MATGTQLVRESGPTGKPVVGLGVYSIAEAARYTSLHSSRVRAWFRGRPGKTPRRPVFRGDFAPVGGDYGISFLDLIDALVMGRFREAGVTMPVIREAYRALSEELATPHPFAHSTLRTDGKNVIVDVAGKIDDRVLNNAITRQLLFGQLRDVLDLIEYKDDNGLAHLWRIAAGVTIDPGVGLGKPVVESTGVHTRVIAGQLAANANDAAIVADLFGLTEEQVWSAAQFETGLRTVA